MRRCCVAFAVARVCLGDSTGSAPRIITVKNDQFVDASGQEVKLFGSNVVVKGPPWLPEVSGSSRCYNNHDCRTFNKADAEHFQSMGWNFMRLGLVWAGAQPTSEAKLDDDVVRRLLAILDLCHDHGIHVMIDFHQDAIASQNCGEGLPVWFFKESQPLGLVGWPLVPQPKWPYPGYCGPEDFSGWSEYSGEEQYNVKNKCCKQYNQDGWARLVPTVQGQAAMYHTFNAGRDKFAAFAGMVARAVKDHPSAFAIELMNEPPSIERGAMYDTWMAAYKAIVAEVPDMAVALADTGNIPISDGTIGLSDAAKEWIDSKSPGLFYAFHIYIPPSESVTEAMTMATLQGIALGGIPAVLTETMDCDGMRRAAAELSGAAHWHYSNYCDGSFGACITGWGAGNTDGCGHAGRFNASIVV